MTYGKLNADQLVHWYRELDYLIITSDTEGGPYPVMEAIAAGVPVIAPDVGWCWDYPVIRYASTEGLVQILNTLGNKFSDDPWKAASEDLQKIFGKILESKR